MRVLLLDWMFEVSAELFLKWQTYYLAVDYLDRYFSLNWVPKRLIQVAGTAALYIAAKMEEINPPKIHTLVEATDGGSTKE